MVRDDARELGLEILERAASLHAMSVPQIDGWVSGLADVFTTDQTVREFIDLCAAEATSTAQLVIEALASVAPDELGAAARRAHHRIAGADPLSRRPWNGHAAWRVSSGRGQAILLSFDDGSVVDHAHGLIVELDDGRVTDLHIVEAPRHLIDALSEADDSSERADVEVLSPSSAVGEVARIWQETAAQPLAPTGQMRTNAWFARSVLAAVTGHELNRFMFEEAEVDVRRGLSPEEFDRANAAACSTLRSGAGSEAFDAAAEHPAEDLMMQAWASVVRGDVAGLTDAESAALLYLEWADWLGAGLGLWRSGPGTPVGGEALVDFVNRCPEVSSTVPAKEREYVAWAFDLAAEHLSDCDVVENGVLTVSGHRALLGGLVQAWTGVG